MKLQVVFIFLLVIMNLFSSRSTVKTNNDRDNYSGYSIKASSGHRQEGKDSTWYAQSIAKKSLNRF